MKKVLIAIDYNPVSEKIAKAGYALAQQLDAEVCLIHVVADARYYGMSYPDFMGYGGFDTAMVDLNIASEMKNEAQRFLETAAKHLANSGIKTHLAEGNTADAILKYATEWNADILVLGTHSHSILEKIFMGSVAATIIEETNIPAYLIPVKKD